MAARLGMVLYWAGILLAVFPVGLAIYLLTQPNPQASTIWVLLIFGVVLSVGGRACKYVLAGR